MSGNSVSKKKKILLAKLIIFLLFIAVIIFVLVSLAVQLITGSSWLTGLWSKPPPSISVEEFNFDVGRDRVFASHDGHIAAVGTLGVKVLDFEGRETLRDPLRMSQPALKVSGKRFIAFDIGGSSVRIFNSTQILTSIETTGSVVSASLNDNGWFCIVTQEGGGLRGTVAVYDTSGTKRFEVNMGSGFVLAAVLSNDNRNLAILNLSETGSRINFYYGLDTDRINEPDYMFDSYRGLIIDISYLQNGDVLAISTDSLFLVESSGEGKMIHSFIDKRLGSYAFSDDFIALHLYDYGVGISGQLLTFLTDGTALGDIDFDREVFSLSTINKTAILLKNDGVTFYNEELEEFPMSAQNLSIAGATRIIAINDSTAIAASDNSAVVVIKEREEER